MKYGLGVVIGKFYPPHRGHKLLIETAQAKSVTVIVAAKPGDTIPGALRQQWIQEIHPRATVLLIDDRYDENDSGIWAENTIRWLGRAPDVVFTSEGYGVPYARIMNCAHVLVDKQRTAVPCSGTAIRADPYANWEFLEAPVRAWFVKRVCVLGAESTGTTTLSQALAGYYQTTWVPEFGREYNRIKLTRGETVWHSNEFVHIAQEQNRTEDEAARAANRVLICDTNAFATRIWHLRYMGTDNPQVAQIAAKRRYDLYFLTGDEIPFIQDGLRDGENIRHQMHEWFVKALEAQSTPWLLLRGSPEKRVREGVAAIDALFENSAWSQINRKRRDDTTQEP